MTFKVKIELTFTFTFFSVPSHLEVEPFSIPQNLKSVVSEGYMQMKGYIKNSILGIQDLMRNNKLIICQKMCRIREIKTLLS